MKFGLDTVINRAVFDVWQHDLPFRSDKRLGFGVIGIFEILLLDLQGVPVLQPNATD